MAVRKKGAGPLVILAYDGLRTFEYAIAVEIFRAERCEQIDGWYEPKIVCMEGRTARGYGGVVIEAEAGLDAIEAARTIVIPGWRDPQEAPPPKVLNALRRATARKARVLSICSGAFALAHAGLLDGKRATTHWLYMGELKSLFPEVIAEEDVLYVDAGDIICSAGSAAGIDACLHLIRRDFDARTANMIARRLVAPPHREGGQAQYVETPVAARAGRTIGQAIDWARMRLDKPLRIADLADRAAMSERTFLRRFEAAVGMRPNEWLQRERMARARELLESSSLILADVAAQCGYESPDTFRVAFRRIVGVSPGVYRQRFNREAA